jgi:hypothetical protein
MRVKNLLSLLLTASLAGCGGSAPPSKNPPVYKAGGIVNHNGAPVEGASVRFMRTDGKAGASATTDAQGKFVLTTYAAGDGVAPGDYMVGVSKFDLSKADLGKGAPGDADYRPPAADAPPPKNLLPAKYAEPSPMGLSAKVTAEGPNDFTFDLK